MGHTARFANRLRSRVSSRPLRAIRDTPRAWATSGILASYRRDLAIRIVALPFCNLSLRAEKPSCKGVSS